MPESGHGQDEEERSIERAAIYVRTSSENQRFSYSLDEQARRCWERCDMKEWEVVYVFRDEARSGKDTGRPKFQKMMSKAESRDFDVVVFWKLDRFSRSLMHVVNLEQKFRELNIALHSVTEQIDTTTAAGRFNFRNIANAAEFERDMIKQRTKMGHRALANDHKWPNDDLPLGYERKENGKLSIIDGEAELVREIFGMYLEKRSMPQVAHELNEKSIKTTEGNDWIPRAVGDILRNELYIGKYQVADVDETIEEYRILQDDIFEQVHKVRHRFQRDEQVKRDRMNENRK
jgi:site-specific DNA recombinase